MRETGATGKAGRGLEIARDGKRRIWTVLKSISVHSKRKIR